MTSHGANFPHHGTPSTVTLIAYRGEIVACAGARRVYLAPHVAALDEHDPLVLFVSLMAAYALRVNDGQAPGPYTDERAERYARCALIDDQEFRRLDASRIDDRLLAGHFEVPIEQIEEKRWDLRLER